jgi:hypothetical protein
MDPEVTLHELRKLANKGRWTKADAERFADLFNGLDHWLTIGGFLPKRWDVPRGKAK